MIEVAKQDPVYDWVRLKSGEWIKGEIKGYYEEVLEFESDVLDRLNIKEKDVNSIISARSHSLKLRDGSVIHAPLEIIDRQGFLFGNPQAFTFFEVLTIASEKQSGIDIWDIKVDLGVSLSAGNSDQVEWNARLNAKRKTVDSRLLLDFFAVRSKTNDIETENNGSLSATYDIFYTEKVFFRPLLLTVNKDPFKNIESEYTLGAGAGYYFINTPKIEWDISVGPSYRKTNFVNVFEEAEKSETSFGWFLESYYEIEVTKDVDFEASYSLNYGKKDNGGMRHELFLTVEYEIIEDVDLDLSFIWDRTSDPQADEFNIVPEKDDFRTFITLGIEL